MIALYLLLALSSDPFPALIGNYKTPSACQAAAEAFRAPVAATAHSNQMPLAAFCVPIEQEGQTE